MIFGSMNFGPQVNEKVAQEMLLKFLSQGNSEIDSAYVYNEGQTEEILGSVIPNLNSYKISIATKIHPRITGYLDRNTVYSQFNESLRKMKLDKLDILYFHFPSLKDNIEDALNAVNDLYNEGKIKEFGLSNFPSWSVVDIWHICEKNNWLKPTLYQGRYNALSRNVENELFPALRKLNIRFYAYNPLAGGMLTGKHIKYDELPQEGRFARLKSYRERYWKKSFFDAVNIITNICKEFNIEPAEAAFRWLTNHSLLDNSKDGIIIGASSIIQLEQNTESIIKEALPQQIIDALDFAWSEAKCESPEYFDFY